MSQRYFVLRISCFVLSHCGPRPRSKTLSAARRAQVGQGSAEPAVRRPAWLGRGVGLRCCSPLPYVLARPEFQNGLMADIHATPPPDLLVDRDYNDQTDTHGVE